MANERKKFTYHRRIHLLDVALIALLVLSVLAVWQRQNLAYIFEGDHTQRAYSVSFETVGVEYGATESLLANTVVFANTEQGAAELGVLLDEVTVLPRTQRVMGEDGTYSDVLMLPQKDSDLVDAVGTLSCHGVMREGALIVGDVTLTVGESLLVSGADFELEFRVLSISEIR